MVVNTAITKRWKVDLLIIDEEHRVAADSFKNIFDVVKYKLILGLTATLERLDGKEEIIKKYAPICDTIPLELALLNGWISKYSEYQVLIEVDDIDTYKEYDREFQQHFEFFDRNFPLIMDKDNGLLSKKNGLANRLRLRDAMCPPQYDRDGNLINDADRKAMLRDITFHATAFNRAMQARKAFINNHSKKLEIVRKIIQARPTSKIITFANSVKMAESVGIGKVYSGKDTKKKGRITIDEFKRGEFKVLNTIKKCDEGLDVPGLSVAIQFGLDSSGIKAKQRLGRVIRAEEGKVAEMFTIVVNDTVECDWFKRSHARQSNYLTIDEQGLEDVLAGKEPKPYVKPIKRFMFRY